MNVPQFVLGIVLFVVFWAFQVGYASTLGTHAWFAGAIIFTILLWLIYKLQKKKVSAEMTALWNFVVAFLIVATAAVAYVWPSLGAVAVGDMTPLVLSFWLVVYGAAMFAGGHKAGDSISTTLGVIWLFSAFHIAWSAGPNSYLQFALVTGLPYILLGLLSKKK